MKRASFSLWLIDQGILKHASCGLRLPKKRNVTFKAPFLFWFMAFRTRNITFEATYSTFGLWLIERALHLKGASSGLWPIERGILHLKTSSCCLRVMERKILHLKRASFLVLKERGKLHLKLACFDIWLTERGILHLKRACFGL